VVEETMRLALVQSHRLNIRASGGSPLPLSLRAQSASNPAD
jgi:hypothetical protein